MSLKASVADPVLTPLRIFAGDVGRSPQFLYSEIKRGRLKTIWHYGRRFVHRDERKRYIAAVVEASPDYCGRASSPTKDAREHATAK